MLLVKNTCLERELSIKIGYTRNQNGLQNRILGSINKKDKLYKTLIQTDIDNTFLYKRLRPNLKTIVQA